MPDKSDAQRLVEIGFHHEQVTIKEAVRRIARAMRRRASQHRKLINDDDPKKPD